MLNNLTQITNQVVSICKMLQFFHLKHDNIVLVPSKCCST